MFEVAARLSDEEIAALSGYIGQLEPIAAERPVDAESVTGLGEKIATKGLPDRGIPACLSCHGAETTSRIPAIARLNGQYVQYLMRRLTRFHGGSEGESGNPMYRIADQMTDVERSAVAAWFSEQMPLSDKAETASVALPDDADRPGGD